MKAGERAAAFDEFAVSMTPRLRRAAFYIALNRDQADDLVQHALEKTFTHWTRACDAPSRVRPPHHGERVHRLVARGHPS